MMQNNRPTGLGPRTLLRRSPSRTQETVPDRSKITEAQASPGQAAQLLARAPRIRRRARPRRLAIPPQHDRGRRALRRASPRPWRRPPNRRSPSARSTHVPNHCQRAAPPRQTLTGGPLQIAHWDSLDRVTPGGCFGARPAARLRFPEVGDDLPVALDAAAEDQYLESVGAGLEGACGSGANAYRVQRYELDEFVV